MTPNSIPPPQPAKARAPRRWLLIVMWAVAISLVSMPLIFWYQTWFGRELTDEDLSRYLQDEQHPRRIQHALSQISDRMSRGGSSVSGWYPQILAAARNSRPEIRSTAAWVMGQDNNSQIFHDALLKLLSDPEPSVRRNAALSLVRFGDGRGRPELLDILRPQSIRAPVDGVVALDTPEGQAVVAGIAVGSITGSQGEEIPLRAPLSGRLESLAVKDGSRVKRGDEVLFVRADSSEVWEALRGLYFVGSESDLEQIDQYRGELPDMDGRIRQQAALTAEAIRNRAGRSPIP
ncbi:MAG TPA: HEAT repeat domain-containing protein [Bryobacteraceae bacterium]|nr:HEAT repeat domain-containing protein [Bryobacteraceae bacterium]